ncbi:expressed unknown protein [Ectocarpus siliculosus]|uniref:Stress-associated endoplasmic reticulum protein n=1 Tax=Ectocarpus siliculosus TaxID=2880 RepID=D7G487_ECTSI|nr:expressed unknown protein [Ectocarpus siliculosus]|eukprot:CBJ27102.1 expressed unknown protein [Ectocarpus siliculosus]
MSSRKTRLASEKHLQNVTRRGSVPKGKIENKKTGYAVGPCLLFFFLFVVLGSSLFQVLKAAGATK